MAMGTYCDQRSPKTGSPNIYYAQGTFLYKRIKYSSQLHFPLPWIECFSPSLHWEALNVQRFLLAYPIFTSAGSPHLERAGVTVCHYPAGASKWNPIEHRLFSEISKNWAGCPLRSYEMIVNHISTTRTETGLRVTSHLVDKKYPKGVKIPDAMMRTLALAPHETQPLRNYTIHPRS